MEKRIFLSPPDMGANEQKYIEETFVANRIAPLGTKVTQFEDSLAQFIGGNKEVVALQSGTSAIHLGLKLLGVQAKDEVICQSFTFVASVNPVLYLGAVPVFVDSEPDTWNICPKQLEKAIKTRIKVTGKAPKAIIAVHLYGMPFKEEVLFVAKKYNIPILEDSAEALGSFSHQKACGTLGKVGVFSFNGNKIITTSAGGALVVSSKEEKEKIIFWATQAKEKEHYYQHQEVGYNYSMSNILAAIGCGQMQVLQKHIEKRRNTHNFYTTFFDKITGVSVLQEPNEVVSNYWLTTIVIDKNKTNKTPVQLKAVLEKYNIESRFLWKPMHLQPLFKNYVYYGTTVAEKLFTSGLCLPSGSGLTFEDKNRIKKVLLSFFS